MKAVKCARKVADYMPTFESVFDEFEFGTSDYETRQKAKAKKRFRKSYDDIVGNILSAFSSSDEMTVYREVCIRKDSIDDFIRDILKKADPSTKPTVGVFWSYDKDYAVSYYALPLDTARKGVILEAVVSCDDINFDETIVSAIRYTGEREIRLKRGSRIRLKKVATRDLCGDTEMSKAIINEFDAKMVLIDT